MPCVVQADDSSLDGLVGLIAQVDDPGFHLDLLKGMRDGLRGRKQVPMPKGWAEVYPKLASSKSAEVREEARLLALVFGDERAHEQLRMFMMNTKLKLDTRQAALKALVEKHANDVAPLLQKLVGEPEMAAAALRGLAAYDHQKTPQVILAHYAKLPPGIRSDAVNTLASRVAYALVLLKEVESGTIDRSDVSAFAARQLENLGDEEITKLLREVWGEVRSTGAEKLAAIRKLKAVLTSKALEKADMAAGRQLFVKTCAQCHKLYGEGGAIGPDLTGSNRFNIDYILENVLDPGAVIGKDYRLTNIITEDGRLVSGIVVEETDRSVTIATVNQRVVLSKEDIDERQVSPVSMMPEGQFDKLSRQQIRDLVGYLATRVKPEINE